jgi:hypothetical protein
LPDGTGAKSECDGERMIIAGQLSEYSLPLLVEILTRNGETGVLVLEHADVSGSLHFINGKLSVVSVGELTGPEAISFTETLEGATFSFERLTIVEISQKVWSETMALPKEGRLGALRAKALSVPRTLHRFLRKEVAGEQTPPESGSPVSLSVSSPERSELRWFLLAAVGAVIIIGVIVGLSQRRPASATEQKTAQSPAPATKDSEAITVPQRFGSSDLSRPTPGEVQLGPTPQPVVERLGVEGKLAAEDREIRLPAEPPALISEHTAATNRPEASPQSPPPTATPDAHAQQTVTPSGPQTVNVVLQIENGRVTRASVLVHHPGLDDYEAAALRTARQRRYPASFSGQETVPVQVERQR